MHYLTGVWAAERLGPHFPYGTLLVNVCGSFILGCLIAALVWLRRRPGNRVGLMLLAASPGGSIANIFSHLSNGDVALNITLTAVNSLLSLLTLPIVVNLSLAYFMGEGRDVPPGGGIAGHAARR